ncbi:MAG: ABC transporter ATP-binding protein [Thermoguttaceae bacterium]|nr:ABC transporter ATP-binding protein [Thermoguttaceae bacterium]
MANNAAAPRKEIILEAPIYNSYRVRVVAGMFDVPIEAKARTRVAFEPPPGLGEDWRIGAIVGPSGSGKSTVAASLYGANVYRGAEWPDDRAVVDCFGERPMKEIIAALGAAGLNSPPSWARPYRSLSVGEKFRCDLARALLDSEGETVVFDEYASVVDVAAARTASASLAKYVRNSGWTRKFVAVAHRADVVEWLEPDWTLDMASGRLTRGRLRRPRIELEIYRADREIWRVFAPHHYLSGALSPAATCYAAFWRDALVAFCATLPSPGFKNRKRVTRLATLPEYQGVGIGTAVLEGVGDMLMEKGNRFGITSGHPAIARHCERSPRWRTVAFRKTGRATLFGQKYSGSFGRAVASFEYLGAAEKRD